MNKILTFLLITLFFISCKEENKVELENSQVEVISKKDSISISLEMKAKTSNGLNAWLRPYDEFFLEFKNISDQDTIITKKLPLLYDYYQMNFSTFKNT